MPYTVVLPDIEGLIATVDVTATGVEIKLDLPHLPAQQDAATLRAYRDKMAAEQALNEAAELGRVRGYEEARAAQDELEKQMLANGQAEAERDGKELLDSMAAMGEGLGKLTDHPLHDAAHDKPQPVGQARDAQREEHAALMQDARKRLTKPRPKAGPTEDDVPARAMRQKPGGKVVHLVLEKDVELGKLKRKAGQTLCFVKQKQGCPPPKYVSATGVNCPLCLGQAQAIYNRSHRKVMTDEPELEGIA